MRVLSIPTTIHGRVLFQDAAAFAPEVLRRAVSTSGALIVAFHGYGESGDDALAAVRSIAGSEAWAIAAPQALHRFYTRDQQKVVGSWMTRQDRELAIADNVGYVDRVIAAVRDTAGNDDAGTPGPVCFIGFSQGASMAYRAALMGSHRPAGIVALGGDIPPEVKTAPANAWPPVLIGAGMRDDWFNGRVDSDLAHLRTLGVAHDVVRFDGGHEWTDEFRDAVSEFLVKLTTGN